LLDIQPNDNVLDLGCGTGHISKLIKEKTKGKVVGVDPSEGMKSNHSALFWQVFGLGQQISFLLFDEVQWFDSLTSTLGKKKMI